MNYDEVNSQLNDYKNITFTYKQYFMAFYNILIEDMNFYLNVSIILLLVFYEGFIGCFLIFLHIYFIIFENKILSLKGWKTSYIFFLLVLSMKYILRSKYLLIPFDEKINSNLVLPNSDTATLIFFFFGKMNQLYFIIIFIIFEIVFSRLGHSHLDKNFSEIENNSQAIFRLSFN